MFKSKFLLAAAVFSIVPNMAMATTVYDEFGSFPDATWGGSGIPNDAVAVSRQFYDGDIQITLAMSATQRYSNPAPTNNAAGAYFVQTGSNFGGAGESATEGALWNFNYYMKVEDTTGLTTPLLEDYQIDLYYDFDPAAAFSLPAMGKIDMTAALTGSSLSLLEDSQNLMFGFLATSGGALTAPTYTPFDPNAIGEYQFAIQVAGGGFNLETVAMEVHTVPVHAAVWLFGSGLIGLAGIARGKTS